MKRRVGCMFFAAALLYAQYHLGADLDTVPAKARAKANPLAGDASAPVAGRKLFADHCGVCHGNGGEGGKHAPPLIGAEMQSATPGQIFFVITNGVVRHGMPSWSKLPEPERWQIVSFLTSLNKPGTSQ